MVDDGYVFSAAAHCRAGRVHGHIAGANNDNVVAGVEQGFAGIKLALIGQNHHTQEIGGSQNAAQLLAGNVQGAGQGGTSTHENRIIALRE